MDNLKDLKILYIDDEEFIRKSAVMYLQFYCDYVYEACDGEDGIKQYEKYQPDIIITDIKMPKLNGLDMVKHIRQKDKQTKIIIATAFLETSFLLQAVELGLIKYLIKPITEEKLLPVLNACVEDVIQNQSIFELGDGYVYDTLNEVLFLNKKPVALTKKELELMSLFVKNHQRAVKYEEINNIIWEGMMSDDALRSIVRDIRKKTCKDMIKNVSGIGYKIGYIE